LLKFERFKEDISDIAKRVFEGLTHIGEAVPDMDGARVIGPIRVFVANAHRIVESRELKGATRRSGWRGLVLRKEDPIAVIDLPPARDSERLRVAVRGGDAARALFDALQAAELVSGAAERHELRVITMPRLFIQALWLRGPHDSRFIPTRSGSATRPAASVLSADEFVSLVEQRLRGSDAVSEAYRDEARSDAEGANDPPARQPRRKR
jgi:hypothetical protein